MEQAEPAHIHSSRTEEYLSVLKQWEQTHRHQIICSVALLLPLKLSLTYIVLCPALLIFIVTEHRKIFAGPAPELIKPLLLFLGVASLSSGFGIDPLNSLLKLGQVLFFTTLVWYVPSCIKTIDATMKVAMSWLAGQALAATHSIADSALAVDLPRVFLGAVTEGGQLALAVPFALGLSLLLVRAQSEHDHKSSPEPKGFLTALVLISLSFGKRIGVPEVIVFAGIGLLIVFTIICCVRLLRKIFSSETIPYSSSVYTPLVTLILPLLSVGLLVNMKRGPWIGVLLAGTLFLFVYRKKFIIPLLSLLLVMFVFLTPLQKRALQSANDFFIHGGRSEIWRIGVELTTQYPLGIGYENSSFLRRFSPEIPENLRHFHNNLLNIVVETGWPGLFLYLWWIFTILRAGIRPLPEQQKVILHAFVCSLIAWQTAGLFEYNFGDSEVYLLALLTLSLASIMLVEKKASA